MTPADLSAEMCRICALAPVMPVIVIEDAARAAPLARALVAGGLPALEVTLRTPAALEAIEAMAGVPGAVVGAGTVLTGGELRAARAAGARFAVSPGATPTLIEAASMDSMPILPGAVTSSEVMALMERGFALAKFFPAEPAGGVAALKALAGPFPGMGFCPTGGVGPANMADYLGLSNVVCVGGSWVAPSKLISSGRWDEITSLADTACRAR